MHSAKGFAYMWVLFLVFLTGLLLTAAAEVYVADQTRQKEKELIFAGRQIRDAIGRYFEAAPRGVKEYPPSLEALLQDPRTPEVRRHLRKLYVDPMTGKSDWGVFRVEDKIVGVFSLSERRPFKQGNFEPGESEFSKKEKYSEWIFAYPPGNTMQKTR